MSLRLHKRVPVGVGLGSSAASSAAAAVGVDSLFSLKLPPARLIRYAGEGEKLASGKAHYDNVAACVLGGFIIASKGGFVRMDPPPSLALCLAIPALDLPPRKTEYARSLLPTSLSLARVVEATAGAAAMVHGFAVGDVGKIGSAMEGGFVDSYRARMVPGFSEARTAALKAGAAGVCISGAGPALLGLTTRHNAKAVLGAMVRTFGRAGVNCEGFVTKIGRGCKVDASR